MKKVVNKRAAVVGVIILATILFFGFELYRSKYALVSTHYTITDERIEERIRMVQITDLHNSEFGTDNEKLAAKVEEEEPDLIFITGDLLDSREENTEIAVNLIRRLAGSAPVYISYGNHEQEYISFPQSQWQRHSTTPRRFSSVGSTATIFPDRMPVMSVFRLSPRAQPQDV